MDAITQVPVPANEPVHDYAPKSPERTRLRTELASLADHPIDLPHVIGGRHRMGDGERIDVVQPHRHAARLGTLTNATHADAAAAVEAAMSAKSDWAALPFDERAAVFLRAADLLAGPWREKIAAATMLGQSKSVYQAEIDAVCELIDFWRFNVAFARQILEQQPISGPGEWNRIDYRPLDGFVYAITPFNFTSIAGNLPTAPALMGNTVIWKPSITQTLAAYLTMQLLEAAGLPPGVINLVTGDGFAVSDVALADPRLAGIHFTGSTATFGHLWHRYLSIDYLGENVTDADDAAAAVRAYLGLLDVLGRRGDIACDGVRPLEVSLKLSALGQALDRDGQKIALDNARAICERAERVGAWVTVDAEDHTTTDSTLSISGDLRVDFPWLGTVVQAYLRRTLADCAELAAVGARVRLCKGAYDEPASVAYRDAAQVTDSYLRCLRVLTAGRGYPMVATHDPVIIAAVPGITRESGRSQGDFEYQMLYGVRDDEQRRLTGAGNHVRVYVPFGTRWYGYFLRRLAERPANLAFFLRALTDRRRARGCAER